MNDSLVTLVPHVRPQVLSMSDEVKPLRLATEPILSFVSF